MMSDTLGRVAASFCIIVASAVVLHEACLRASTIYFFELDTTFVIFVGKGHALVVPLILSGLLYLVYLGTKRDTALRKEKEILKEKELLLLRSRSVSSLPASRKVSRNQGMVAETGESTRRTSFSYPDENMAEQARTLKHLLSAIEEQDTIQSQKNSSVLGDVDIHVSDSVEDTATSLETESDSAPRFTVEKVDYAKIILPPESSPTPKLRSRAGTNTSTWSESATKQYEAARKFSEEFRRPLTESTIGFKHLEEEDRLPLSDPIDIYRQLGNTDLLTYTLSALNLLPNTDDGPHVFLRMNIMDFVAEVFAIHVPVWACVAALYIVLLELFTIKLSYYIYYHHSFFSWSALVAAILFGILHEWRGNWITNDVLAFASIYVICSRFQAVGYQSAVILAVGMGIFDLFWLYVIDLLSTVTSESRAPYMIVIPRDWEGTKQSLATLDIMIPGIFLNVVLKYSSMYDTGLFWWSFYSVCGALAITLFLTIWRRKITPGLVLPAVAAIAASMGMAVHRGDLWRFLIRH